jgi:hypothetical protein
MDNPVIRKAKLTALNNKGHWIQSVVESPSFKKGAFSKKAKKAHVKTKMYMQEVLFHPEDFDPTTRKQAQFMKNILKKD